MKRERVALYTCTHTMANMQCPNSRQPEQRSSTPALSMPRVLPQTCAWRRAAANSPATAAVTTGEGASLLLARLFLPDFAAGVPAALRAAATVASASPETAAAVVVVVGAGVAAATSSGSGLKRSSARKRMGLLRLDDEVGGDLGAGPLVLTAGAPATAESVLTSEDIELGAESRGLVLALSLLLLLLLWSAADSRESALPLYGGKKKSRKSVV